MARVKLGDVATEYKDTFKGDKSGIPVVGLEHLIPQDITLSQWDIDTENTFTKAFKKGHVLFGRRRAYLKKAALAPFDGICSGDITVIEAIEEKLYPELLPFLIQNDFIFDYAVEKSAGSLSPRVKWEHLKDFEFELPEYAEQKRLSKLLWGSYRCKEAYQNLLKKTYELVKSQFIEMFGSCERKPLGDHISQIRGVSYKPVDLSLVLDEDHITLLRANNITDGTIIFDNVQYVSKKRVSETQVIQPKDILMCASSGSLEHVGKAALCRFSGKYTFGAFCKLIRATGTLSPEFIASYMNGPEYRTLIMELAQGTNINNLKNEHIDKLMIPIPDEPQQLEFIRFAEQLDKSKYSRPLNGYFFRKDGDLCA